MTSSVLSWILAGIGLFFLIRNFIIKKRMRDICNIPSSEESQLITEFEESISSLSFKERRKLASDELVISRRLIENAVVELKFALKYAKKIRLWFFISKDWDYERDVYLSRGVVGLNEALQKLKESWTLLNIEPSSSPKYMVQDDIFDANLLFWIRNWGMIIQIKKNLEIAKEMEKEVLFILKEHFNKIMEPTQ